MVRETVQRAQARLRDLRSSAYGRIAAPIEGLHQAAYVLAGLTLASQLLALLRDRAFAHQFGAGLELDMYYAAFRVPDLVFALVASLVSAYVIIPRISATRNEETQKIISESASFLAIVGGGLCILLAVAMPSVLAYLYPTLSGSEYAAEFVVLSRLLLVQPILLGLSSVYASVTQVQRKFFLFALAPVLYNLGIIAGTLYGYPVYGLRGIGLGVLAGSVAYVLTNVPALKASQLSMRFRVPRTKTLWPIIKDSVPRSLALSMQAVIALILTIFATRLAAGAVSVFTLASNLQAVPLALIGSSYAVAAFPALSKASAVENREEFTNILSASARHIILWSLVAFGLIIVLRAHVVRAILGTGAFDWNATRLTAALLAVLAAGLSFEALKLLFSRALYAARQSWLPLLYQVLGGVVTVGLAWWSLTLPRDPFLQGLAEVLRVGDLADTSILMLALAAVCGQIVVVGVSLVALRRVAPGLSRLLVIPARDGIVAASVAALAAHYVLVGIGDLAPLTTLVNVLLHGLAAGTVGLASAGAVLYLLRNQEFMTLLAVVARMPHSPKVATELIKPSAEDSVHQG